ANELLQHNSGTVSEIAFMVGFDSDSYFNRCFKDYYGYSPGEILKGMHPPVTPEPQKNIKTIRNKLNISNVIFIAAVMILLSVLTVLFFENRQNKNIEKTIAILPPEYIGSDSTYLHQLDGTIMMILDNLSLIGDMKKVIPWISVQQYRNNIKTAVEIEKEMDVSYIVESNGMTLEDTFRLNVKLINGEKGSQLSYYHYEVDTEEFIKLPMNIASRIANEIHAKITQEEKGKIGKVPTKNSTAWNYFLLGRELYDKGLSTYYAQRYNYLKGDTTINEGFDIFFQEAAKNFKKAIENDNKFAVAYAQLAIAYYMLDTGNEVKQYSVEINSNADKAILLDSQNDVCLISKACDYINKKENRFAIPYLEKAVQYNPNSVAAYRILANVYNLVREANTEKYLEYKLMAVKINSLDENIIQKSEDYRLAARALRVAGFYNEAETYIDKSIELNPENLGSVCEKSELIIERDNDYEKAREILFDALQTDSLNTEVLRYLFTNFYFTKDYYNAFTFFNKIYNIDKTLKILPRKDFSRLVVICNKLGMQTESENYLKYFKEANRTFVNSYVSSLEMTRFYSLENNKQKALDQLNIFNQQKYHFIYSIRMLKDDAVFENINNLPEFKKTVSELETKFWANHQRIKANLKDKRLLLYHYSPKFLNLQSNRTPLLEF
ncbi:MAG: helix-turn-helix domain-containing protein, partial [Draconibacterium sp.]|nr:helix-turn-helix domain-containing protein [Draconibacterium sp.]